MRSLDFNPFFPPLLPKGGTVGLVAPSRYPRPDWVESAKSHFESRGYRCRAHPQVYAKDRQFAGPDEVRSAALNDMFADPSIDAILCARGGTGAMLLLDKLDYGLIRANPKPFVGFSDVTALLQAISSQTGMVTFHGPMGWNFTEDMYDPRTFDELLAAIGERETPWVYETDAVEIVRPGVVEGRLIGGNLSLLQSLVGTPYDWEPEGAVLFVEEVGEYLYRMERMLAHLRLAGKLKGLRAVVIGEILEILDDDPLWGPQQEPPYGRSAKELFLSHLPADIPIVFGFPCGHGKHLTTLPVGTKVRLTLEAGKAKIECAR